MASPFYIRNLIKNKSAELIVFEMFQEASGYIIAPFGQEMIVSELASIEKGETIKQEVARLHERPQLSIIDQVRNANYFVKVKYRENPTPQMILSIAQEISTSWPTAYLCLVTPIGFFFDSCAGIIEKEGDVLLIDSNLISLEIQDKYLKLVNETIHQKEAE